MIRISLGQVRLLNENVVVDILEKDGGNTAECNN